MCSATLQSTQYSQLPSWEGEYSTFFAQWGASRIQGEVSPSPRARRLGKNSANELLTIYVQLPNSILHVWLSIGYLSRTMSQANVNVRRWLYNTVPSGDRRISRFGTVIRWNTPSFRLRTNTSGVHSRSNWLWFNVMLTTRLHTLTVTITHICRFGFL